MITDFHCHVLPNMDDGSASAEMSVAMLEESARQGIRRMVATPHFYPHRDTMDAFLQRRADAAQALCREKEGRAGLPTVYLGAEVAYCRGMSEWEQLPELKIGQHILIEMPLAPWKKEHYDELRQIWQKQRLRPVIAHIERYITPLSRFWVMGKLESLGVTVQASGEFFLDKKTAAMAVDMLKKGQIHLLGSDCHNVTSRKQNLGEAIKVITDKLGPEALEKIRVYEAQIFKERENVRKVCGS